MLELLKSLVFAVIMVPVVMLPKDLSVLSVSGAHGHDLSRHSPPTFPH